MHDLIETISLKDFSAVNPCSIICLLKKTMELSSTGLRILPRGALYLVQNNITLTALNGVGFLLTKALTKKEPMARTANPKGKAVIKNMQSS